MRMSRILFAAKTDLDCITHEQTIICRQLFAGHVVGSQPMKMGEKIHRMIKFIHFVQMFFGVLFVYYRAAKKRARWPLT